MPEQPEITIKEIKLDNKVICKYHVDNSNTLQLNVINRNYSIREITELEEYFLLIISIIEQRRFYACNYM
jgi:hypothetical protein